MFKFMGEKPNKFKQHWKKTWNFFWNDDSIWSWLANIVVAFIVIRFIVYPLLGLLLGTSYPIVAVISESMDHGTSDDIICGQRIVDFPESFDNYWTVCGQWYESNGITKEEFRKFPFRDGFRKGDVILLWRANSENLEVGNVLIFQGSKVQPIIHRIVSTWNEDGSRFYQTKGDHNSGIISGTYGEEKIGQERVLGKGIIRIPYLGWLKILFVDAVKPLGINIVR
jgi:hypothetical protein